MKNVNEKGKNAVWLYKKRLFILLCIGIIHAVFIWSGDILVNYAMVGFVLLLFRNKTPESIIKWALWLLITPIAVVILLSTIGYVFSENNQMDSQMVHEARELVKQSIHAYGEGTYADTINQRLIDLGQMYSVSFFYIPNILAMFLFGVYAGKKRILHDIPNHLPFIRKVWRTTLMLGLILVIFHIVGVAKANPMAASIYDVLSLTSFLSGPVLCFFYVSSMMLLSQKVHGQQILKKIAPVGRMGITNYLMQSVICTTLFYHYGFGLYGKVSPSMALLIVFFICGLQIVLSTYWMGRHRYGPVECVWRRLTYGKLL